MYKFVPANLSDEDMLQIDETGFQEKCNGGKHPQLVMFGLKQNCSNEKYEKRTEVIKILIQYPYQIPYLLHLVLYYLCFE